MNLTFSFNFLAKPHAEAFAGAAGSVSAQGTNRPPPPAGGEGARPGDRLFLQPGLTLRYRQTALGGTLCTRYCTYSGSYAVGPWRLLVVAPTAGESLFVRVRVFWVLALR